MRSLAVDLLQYPGFVGSKVFEATVVLLTLKVVVLTLKVVDLTPKVMYLTTDEERVVLLTADD